MEKALDPVHIVSNYLQENQKYNLRGQALFNGNSKANYAVIKEILNDDALLIELDLFMVVKSNGFSVRDFNHDVLNTIKDTLVEVKRDEAGKLLHEDMDQIDPMKFLVFKDIEAESEYHDKDKFIVERDTLSQVEGFSILAYRHLIGEETYQSIKPQFPLAKRVYNPYLINEDLNDKSWKEYSESLGCNLTCINECIQPKWRYDRDLSLKLAMEEKYFIETSFVDKESLQYYIDSSYATVVDKMWSYVMLYGVKGTGKTTLIEMLIGCVGKSNYRKAPQNALKKEFNGYKKNKRLVLMDEMVADTNAAINILKSDANKEFNVEEKSKETESVTNFVSMWIATNNISDWKFTYDERRFSVLELTKQTTIEREIEDSWMSEFSLRIETEEFAQAFFNYLEENKSKDFNTMKPYKSEAFYQVVYESLKPWEMKIVDEIINGEETDKIQLSSLYDEHDKYQPATHKKVIDFLDNYRHRGEKLGEYERGKSVRNSFIIPLDKYRAKEKPTEMKDM